MLHTYVTGIQNLIDIKLLIFLVSENIMTVPDLMIYLCQEDFQKKYFESLILIKPPHNFPSNTVYLVNFPHMK